MLLPWHLGKQMTRWYRRICTLSLSFLVSWVMPFDMGPHIYPPTFPKIDLTSIFLLDKRISQSQESLLHSTSIQEQTKKLNCSSYFLFMTMKVL